MITDISDDAFEKAISDFHYAVFVLGEIARRRRDSAYIDANDAAGKILNAADTSAYQNRQAAYDWRTALNGADKEYIETLTAAVNAVEPLKDAVNSVQTVNRLANFFIEE